MKRFAGLVRASAMLFFFGVLNAGIYVAELVDSGDRMAGFLEGSCALLAGAWIVGSVYLLRVRAFTRR